MNDTAPLPSAVFPAKKVELVLPDPAPDADTLAERKAFDRKNRPAFVRKPHLTDRPLANNAELRALKDSLPINKSQTPKPRTRRRQTASTK